MEEKNIIIHNKEDEMVEVKPTALIEKLTTTSVVNANKKMAFTAYLVRNSCLKSF
jgi:hypothetical protein